VCNIRCHIKFLHWPLLLVIGVRRFGGRASKTSFFQTFKKLNLKKFKKKKYQSVVYDLFYLFVNLHYEISCIMSSAK
jgi:hypothetical protein